MKKIILALLVISSLYGTMVSCNNKAAEETVAPPPPPPPPPAPAEAPAANEVAAQVQLPSFTDKSVNDYCAEYKKIIDDYAALKGTGDKAKELDLEKRTNAWVEKAGALAGKIKPEEMQKFNDFIMTCEKAFKEMKTAATNTK